MIPIDSEELDLSNPGYADFFYKGKLFSGIAYERDADTGVIVGISGYRDGWLTGCARTWSPSGILLEEIFYHAGGFRGPVRKWHPDGTLMSNDYFPRSIDHGPRNQADPVIDIDLDEMEFVEHPWGWGKEPAPPPSFDEFHGFKRSEGDKDWYVIEQANAREVVHVEALELKDRSLLVAYERHSLRFSDAFASRLIRAKILGDVCMNAYLGRVDRVVFQSIPTKLVEVVPYLSS
ncbi:MAG TPA: hypothetical protein VJV79_29045 [Polyangiaceae bacterium]|nr:hypothetical protein [Polyangiaceae bacterium]